MKAASVFVDPSLLLSFDIILSHAAVYSILRISLALTNLPTYRDYGFGLVLEIKFDSIEGRLSKSNTFASC